VLQVRRVGKISVAVEHLVAISIDKGAIQPPRIPISLTLNTSP
jgi:hypothetical protein